jgi:Spy/CpxP family protein refolding chaperone
MKHRSWIVAAGLVLAVCVAVTAIAAGNAKKKSGNKKDKGGQSEMKKGGGGRDEMMMGMVMGGGGLMKMAEKLLNDPKFQKEIGLTDTQISQLKTKLSETEKAMIRSKADVQILHIDLKDMLEADNPDAAKIDAKIDELGRLQAENMKTMAHALIEVKSILTKEQIEKAKAYIIEKKGPKGGGKGMKGDHGMMGGDEKGATGATR